MEDFLINIQMAQFISIDDFMLNRERIREEYNKLENSYKAVYKWYFFYQLCILKFKDSNKNYLKDLSWMYLNNSNVEEDLLFCYKEFCASR